MRVQQSLDAPSKRFVTGTSSGEQRRALSLRSGKSLMEDFFCVHGLPLSAQARITGKSTTEFSKLFDRPAESLSEKGGTRTRSRPLFG
jgi:hypothetical protein